MLAALRGCWAPQALVVSFKLETDESILLRKVRTSGGPATRPRAPGSSSAPCPTSHRKVGLGGRVHWLQDDALLAVESTQINECSEEGDGPCYRIA